MGASESYSAVPYEGGVYPQTHPDVLATVASLVGLRPAHPARCRVLELGCADGANLMGMAAYLPDSEFVGLDAAANHIAAGEPLRAEAGLDNVTLLAADLRDPPEDLGTFDYIIAHGVYSWLPPAARPALLRLCRSHLAEHGVAYISYNTMPGWHEQQVIRDLMRFHTRAFSDPADVIAQGRAIVRFAGEASGAFLHQATAEYLDGLPDSYIFHDLLEAENHPLYLHQFIDEVAAEGLQYVGDAELETALDLRFPEPTRAWLHEQTDDPVVIEQYLDFLTNRTLRRSLVCHADVPLQRALDLSTVMGMEVGFPLTLTEERPEGLAYRRPGAPDDMVIAQTAAQRAILEPLRSAWPASLPLRDLPPEAPELLLACALRGFARLRLWSPPVVRQPPERPVLAPLVRAQARRGMLLTSALLQSVHVSDPADLALFARLDGSVAPTPEHAGAIDRLARLGLLLRPGVKL